MSKERNTQVFLEAMNEVDDKYVLEAISYRSAGFRTLKRFLATAAVLVLCVYSGIRVGLRFDHFVAGCSALPGQIIDGVYYYQVRHDGVYAYTPGGSPEKLLSTFWYDSYMVNNYGIYYKDGRRLYVQDHETGERRRLYLANPLKYTHIGFYLQQDGNVIVTLYNKHKEIVSEILMDGKTGALLKTVMEPISYDDADYTYYSDTHFQVGSREIVLAETEDREFVVMEKGQPVCDGDLSLFAVSKWSAEYIGDNLWFTIREEFEADAADGIMYRLVIYPKGGAEQKELCPAFGSSFSGNNQYLFWVLSSSNIAWCYDIEAEKGWELAVDNDMTLYEIETDGQYLYSCVPWDDFQALWEIVCDENGRPVAMHLLDENIRE